MSAARSGAPDPHAAAAGLVTRSFLTLGAGEMIARLIGFAATIYIARELGADAWGIVGFGFAVSLYLAFIADAGLEQHGPQEVTEARLPLGRMIGSVLIGRTLIAAALATALGAVSRFAPAPDAAVLALYGLTLLPAGANLRWAHYGLDNGSAVARARIAAETLRVVLVLLLVRGPDDAVWVPVAQFAGDGLAALWLIVALRRAGVRIEWALDATMLRAVLRRASPLLLNNLLALAIYNADVIFLRFFRDTTEVGHYLAAYTLINFLGVLGNIATVSLVPSLGRLRDDAQARAGLLHTSLARVFVGGLPIAIGGALLSTGILTLVFTDDYAPAGPVLALLIWTIPLLLARSVYMAALIAEARQDLVLRATAIAAAINVGLNFVAVPVLGMVGAAITTLASELTRVVLGRLYVRRLGLPATPAGRYAKTLAAGAVLAAALLFAPALPVPIAVAAGAILFFAVLTALGGIRWGGWRPTLRV